MITSQDYNDVIVLLLQEKFVAQITSYTDLII